jgi:hypothetical protein
METRTEGAPLSDTDTQGPPKRIRRWHHRGFTGCSTCRRRHVRCDEASPACNNCVRLGRECDGAQGRMTFKVYGPSQTPTSSPPELSRAPRRQNNNSTSSPDSSDASTASPLGEDADSRNATTTSDQVPLPGSCDLHQYREIDSAYRGALSRSFCGSGINSPDHLQHPAQCQSLPHTFSGFRPFVSDNGQCNAGIGRITSRKYIGGVAAE